MYSLAKLNHWISGKSLWLSDTCIDEVTQDGCPKYDRELLNPMVSTLRLVIKISIVLGLLLDVMCFKYRSLTQMILPYENFVLSFYIMVPTEFYLKETGFIFQMLNGIMFLIYYCDTGY